MRYRGPFLVGTNPNRKPALDVEILDQRGFEALRKHALIAQLD
jgi:hypothetical protein